MSCDDNGRRLAANGIDDNIGIPFDNDLIKCCPMCAVPIEKDEGCAQMMCKRCKHVFCWYCLASLDVSWWLGEQWTGFNRRIFFLLNFRTISFCDTTTRVPARISSVIHGHPWCGIALKWLAYSLVSEFCCWSHRRSYCWLRRALYAASVAFAATTANWKTLKPISMSHWRSTDSWHSDQMSGFHRFDG